MTWFYSISEDGSTMDVYEDDTEFSGHITTIDNDGAGFEPVVDVKKVMRQTWEDSANIGNSPVMGVRAGCILMDMATENIEQGVPE